MNEIARSYREGRWEPSELNGGKLCEIVYTIIRGFADGSYPSKPSKPKNMVDDCRAMESAGKVHPRSIRTHIPRMLIALYDIRNNRGVGHVGGDVDANQMDAVVVLSMSKWVVAELVRMYHGLDTADAQSVVDSLVQKEIPIIWSVAGKQRILDPRLSMKDKSLALLYGSSGPVAETELFGWVEHSNASVYRRDILRPAHKATLIEFDENARLVHLSPTGIKYAEDKISLALF